MSRCGALLVLALLIERSVEVFLSIWRAEEANKKQADVQRLISAGKSGDDSELKTAHEALIEFRATTQRWAFPSSFILGLLIASFGVRVISQFVVERPAANALGNNQRWWFHLTDIVFTAALLAGGADPIHKLMDAFRKFMEASRQKLVVREIATVRKTAMELADLFDAVKQRECILFLGAGVHYPPPEDLPEYQYPVEERPPLGAQLSHKLARECVHRMLSVLAKRSSGS